MAVVTFTLVLPVEYREEREHVIACFPDLDVVSQGRNKREATDNLIEAAQLFIESCFERNVLDEVLKQCGFAPSHGRQATNRRGREHLTVPFELLAARNGPAAHAC
jgi:hypothetical protein